MSGLCFRQNYSGFAVSEAAGATQLWSDEFNVSEFLDPSAAVFSAGVEAATWISDSDTVGIEATELLVNASATEAGSDAPRLSSDRPSEGLRPTASFDLSSVWDGSLFMGATGVEAPTVDPSAVGDGASLELDASSEVHAQLDFTLGAATTGGPFDPTVARQGEPRRKQRST
jgi:hypothetical protein